MEDEKKEVVTSEGITDKFGDTEQSLATEEAVRIGNKYLMHDGSLAAHDIAERRARGKAADERIRKVLGDVGFENFKQHTAVAQSARDEHFEKMAHTNILHGLVAAHKNANESACNEQIELDTMGSAAETLGVAHDAEQNVEDMQNKLAWVTTTRDHMFHAIDARTDWDYARKQKEKDAVEIAVSAHNTAYALAFGVKESDIEARRASTAIKQTVGLSDAVKKCFERGYSFCKTAGGDHEMCYAKGMEEARNFALRYFKERVARGNIREVLAQLDYFEKKSDAMFQESRVKIDSNGKPVLDAKGNKVYGDEGVFDPSQMLFCRFEDFNSIRDAANSALDEVDRRNRSQIAMQDAARRRNDDILAREADGVELEAKEYFRKNIDSDSSPIDSVSKFLPKIDSLKNRGYKDSAGLYDRVFAAAKSVVDARDAAEKKYKERTADELHDELVDMFNIYSTTSADHVFLSFLTPYGTRQQSEASGGTERRSAIIALGNVLLNKTSNDDPRKKVYESVVEQMKSEKVENDCKTLEQMARACGWELPQGQVRNYFSYSNASLERVENGAVSKQEGNSVLFNKDGVVLMGDQMMVTWRDPSNPDKTFQLGKNEAQQVFRDMFHIISQTPVDELRDPKAFDALKTRFISGAKTAAMSSDANGRYAKLRAIYDNTRTDVLGRGEVKGLSFITRNYRTPMEHKREIELRKKIEARISSGTESK